jgi:hypothetical protein
MSTFFGRLLKVLRGDDAGMYDPLTGDIESGDEYYQEMQDMNDPEKERAYYNLLYNEARHYKYANQDNDDLEPLKPEDFYYQMISTHGDEGTEWESLKGWWMLVDHRIAQIILMTKKSAITEDESERWHHLLVSPVTVLGTQVCYSDEQVGNCVEYVLEKCEEYNLPVKRDVVVTLTPMNTQDNNNCTVEIPLGDTKIISTNRINGIVTKKSD